MSRGRESEVPQPFSQLALPLILILGICCQLQAADEFDPSKVLGVDTCVKCHASEVNQWKQTPHHRTIEELHRKPEAKQIASNLGLRSVKRNDTCVRCHYTRKETNGRVRIDSGISCESCHGPAQDWIDLHADYGPGATRETESFEHKSQRRKGSIAAGMNNPANLYLIARQCLNCHTTPNEKLVDVGGHPAGSEDFNLVAWSQGIVRHNFVRSQGMINSQNTPERLRVMHIVGTLTDLEYSLRASAKATSIGRFGKAAGTRAAKKKQLLSEIQQRLNHPLLAQALGSVKQLELKLDNSEAIIASADAISLVAYRFAEEADGSQMMAIDELLPTPDQYK